MGFKCLFFSAGILLSGAAHAEADDSARPLYGYHHGYTFDVKEERNKRDIEMVMLDQPPPPSKPIKEVIFNEKLSKEFQQQYEYRFGRTAAEQVMNSPHRDDSYTYFTGETLTIQDYQKYQQQFAEYMGRRLTEYHVDNWAKSDPDLRPVYEMKDRIGHLDVTVKKGYNVKWKYNFAGPSMDVNIENPYDIEAKARMEMSGIVSSPNEYIYTLGYQVTPRVNLSFLYRQYDGLYQLVATRRMTAHISMSLTGSVDARPEGPTVQQNLALIGFSWSE